MRLWHESLIPHLPRQWLLGQHRECCALRGLGWGKKHSTVDYVFRHSPYLLYQYHIAIIHEMSRRGYKCDPLWLDERYRGKTAKPFEYLGNVGCYFTDTIYPEHDDRYLQECVENLRGKGVYVTP